ncbi:MAG: V-type ATP synthase subunit E [Candidatus Nanohaloarchaea archaeon]
MGLEQVKSDILEEAEEKADQIVKEAKQEKKEILADAEKEAEKIEQKTEEEIENRKDSLRRKALSNARMKAREEKLKAKQEKLDEAFSTFRQELADLDEDQRSSYVEHCLDQVGFEVGKVIGGSGFEDAVDDQGYDFEEGDLEGIIVVSEDGERRQDFSFDKIVEQYREDHRQEVAEQLFG